MELEHSSTNKLGVTLNRISQTNSVKVRLMNVIACKCQVTASSERISQPTLYSSWWKALIEPPESSVWMRAHAVRHRLLTQLDGWVHTSQRCAARSSYYTSCRAMTVSYSQWAGLGSLSARNKCYPTEQKGKERAMPDVVREWDSRRSYLVYSGEDGKGVSWPPYKECVRGNTTMYRLCSSRARILNYSNIVAGHVRSWSALCMCNSQPRWEGSEMASLVCYFLPFYNQVNLWECKGVIRREWVRESCNDWLIVMSGRHEVIRARGLQK